MSYLDQSLKHYRIQTRILTRNWEAGGLPHPCVSRTGSSIIDVVAHPPTNSPTLPLASSLAVYIILPSSYRVSSTLSLPYSPLSRLVAPQQTQTASSSFITNHGSCFYSDLRPSCKRLQRSADEPSRPLSPSPFRPQILLPDRRRPCKLCRWKSRSPSSFSLSLSLYI